MTTYLRSLSSACPSSAVPARYALLGASSRSSHQGLCVRKFQAWPEHQDVRVTSSCLQELRVKPATTPRSSPPQHASPQPSQISQLCWKTYTSLTCFGSRPMTKRYYSGGPDLITWALQKQGIFSSWSQKKPEIQKTIRVQCPWLVCRSRGPCVGGMGSLQLQRVVPSSQPAKRRGPQPYNLEKLNSANKDELGCDSSQSPWE